MASRGLEIDRLRRLPEDVVESLSGLGVFRMWIPSALGGLEMSLLAGLEVLEELSYWNGSVGWCSMISATTAIQSAYLPEEGARQVYGSGTPVITCGVAEPRGRATRVDGGIVASGRWSWGSNAHHSDYIGGGCLLPSDGEGAQPPRLLFAFFERRQVELHDTWHVGGLRGTGSGDFEVADAFVPEGRWVERAVTPPRFDLPLYRFPHFGLLALGVTMVGLGLARRAIDELRAIAVEKRYVGSSRALAQRPGVQADVARSEAQLLSAVAFVEQVVRSAWEAGESGDLDVEHRRRLRLAATHGMRSAVEIVDRMYDLAGGSAVFEDCALERLLRDVHAASTHGMVAKRTFELTGRLALGLETNVQQL